MLTLWLYLLYIFDIILSIIVITLIIIGVCNNSAIALITLLLILSFIFFGIAYYNDTNQNSFIKILRYTAIGFHTLVFTIILLALLYSFIFVFKKLNNNIIPDPGNIVRSINPENKSSKIRDLYKRFKNIRLGASNIESQGNGVNPINNTRKKRLFNAVSNVVLNVARKYIFKSKSENKIVDAVTDKMSDAMTDAMTNTMTDAASSSISDINESILFDRVKDVVRDRMNHTITTWIKAEEAIKDTEAAMEEKMIAISNVKSAQKLVDQLKNKVKKSSQNVNKIKSKNLDGVDDSNIVLIEAESILENEIKLFNTEVKELNNRNRNLNLSEKNYKEKAIYARKLEAKAMAETDMLKNKIRENVKLFTKEELMIPGV